jgi:hypothetical protein
MYEDESVEMDYVERILNNPPFAMDGRSCAFV